MGRDDRGVVEVVPFQRAFYSTPERAEYLVRGEQKGLVWLPYRSRLCRPKASRPDLYRQSDWARINAFTSDGDRRLYSTSIGTPSAVPRTLLPDRLRRARMQLLPPARCLPK